MKTKLIGLLIMVSMVAVLAMGCVGGSGGQFVTAHPVLVDAVVKTATARVLTEKPEWVDDTVRISWGGLALLGDTEFVSIQAIESYVIDEIGWDDLTPEEVELVVTLISVIRAEIESALEREGVIEAGEKVVYVKHIFGLIYQTAKARQ